MMVFVVTENSLCTKLLPELVVFVRVQFLDHVQHLSDQFPLDHFEQFVLLQGFTADVEGEVVTVHLEGDEK